LDGLAGDLREAPCASETPDLAHGNGKPLIHREDPCIVARLPQARVPVIALDDIAGIAELVLARAVPVKEVSGR